MRKWQSKHFNIIELILALGIVGMGIAAVMAMFPEGVKANEKVVENSYAELSANSVMKMLAVEFDSFDQFQMRRRDTSGSYSPTAWNRVKSDEGELLNLFYNINNNRFKKNGTNYYLTKFNITPNNPGTADIFQLPQPTVAFNSENDPNGYFQNHWGNGPYNMIGKLDDSDNLISGTLIYKAQPASATSTNFPYPASPSAPFQMAMVDPNGFLDNNFYKAAYRVITKTTITHPDNTTTQVVDFDAIVMCGLGEYEVRHNSSVVSKANASDSATRIPQPKLSAAVYWPATAKPQNRKKATFSLKLRSRNPYIYTLRKTKGSNSYQ